MTGYVPFLGLPEVHPWLECPHCGKPMIIRRPPMPPKWPIPYDARGDCSDPECDVKGATVRVGLELR